VEIDTTLLSEGTGVCISAYIENDTTADKQLWIDKFLLQITDLDR